MKIIFLQDRDGRTLRKSIAFAPSCQLVHRGVNIASSDLGGKRSASFELLSLALGEQWMQLRFTVRRIGITRRRF
jgi:hypothetical protein